MLLYVSVQAASPEADVVESMTSSKQPDDLTQAMPTQLSLDTSPQYDYTIRPSY